MRFECRGCAAQLSAEVQMIQMSERNETMGADLLPPGTVMQEDGSYFRERGGFFILHVDDLFNVKTTTDSKRLAGCCGLDGCDGPNLQCVVCGSYVATKMTDCWMPHCAVLEPSATSAIAEA
jgi:hypothetical protein